MMPSLCVLESIYILIHNLLNFAAAMQQHVVSVSSQVITLPVVPRLVAPKESDKMACIEGESLAQEEQILFRLGLVDGRPRVVPVTVT